MRQRFSRLPSHLRESIAQRGEITKLIRSLMKVLQLCAEKSWRGGEQQLANLIQGLKAQGCEVFVACEKGSAFARYCMEESLTYFPIRFRTLFTAFHLKQLCRNQNIDLMHAHSSHAHGSAVISYSLGNQVPIILSRKVDFPIKNNWFTSWKYNHPGIAKILCVSQAIANIMGPAITEAEKLAVVHDGINLERFSNLPPRGRIREEFQLSPKALLIGNVGALSDTKDHHTFLRMAEHILRKHPDAHFLLVGEGELRVELEREIAKRNLSSVVTLTGFRNDVPAILQELDLLVMTSKTEGLGSSILDAFATKTPVVATRAGGIPELIEHRQTGLLAPIGDDNALAKACLDLLEDRRLARDLSKRAYLKLTAEFTIDCLARKTLAHYQQVVSKHP